MTTRWKDGRTDSATGSLAVSRRGEPSLSSIGRKESCGIRRFGAPRRSSEEQPRRGSVRRRQAEKTKEQPATEEPERFFSAPTGPQPGGLATPNSHHVPQKAEQTPADQA